MRTSIIVGLLISAAVTISADLQSDIAEVVSHLPIKEIETIGRRYVAKYPSYGDRLRFVGKTTYVQLVKNFLKTKQGLEFTTYFNGRGIDVESILLYLAQMMMDINRKWLEPMHEGEVIGTKITGDMIADYKRAIAASDFNEAIRRKIKSSPEFANLIAAIKDAEYHALVYDVFNSKFLSRYGVNAEVRGFWGWVWKGIKIAASILLG